MGVAAQELARGRQLHPLEHVVDPLVGIEAGAVVRAQPVAQLGVEPERRVERRARILRDVGDDAAPDVLPDSLGGRDHVDPVDERRSLQLHPLARVAEQRQRHRGLPRARLADEPQHLAGAELEVDAVHDRVRAGNDDPQVGDPDDGLGAAHASSFLLIPATERATPSVTMLLPIVSTAIASTGTSTGQ